MYHNVVCLTTGPQTHAKPVLHRVRSNPSSFNFQYPLVFLRSSSNCLSLLPRLRVTSTLLFILPSITLFISQFLPKIWTIQLPFLLFTVYRILHASLTLCHTASFFTWSVQLIFSILLQHHIPELSSYFWSTIRSVRVSGPQNAMLQL
jgi:hypothetical protein